jgi:hypothetical protein
MAPNKSPLDLLLDHINNNNFNSLILSLRQGVLRLVLVINLMEMYFWCYHYFPKMSNNALYIFSIKVLLHLVRGPIVIRLLSIARI